MNIDTFGKLGILLEALPYIQEYRGKYVVIKYGGNAMQSEELIKAVISDVVLLSCVGIKVVLVHGGGPEINDMLQKTGKESKFINGLRYTDDETMNIVQMVLAGKVNKELVSRIEQAGGRAVGICGIDGGMLKAKRLAENGVDYGLVGDITEVNTDLLITVIDKGYIPVVATVASGSGGESYNINADTAAAGLAAALNAENLILLSDVPGLLRDKNNPETLIPVVNVADTPKLQHEGIISGGMIPKVNCCVEAIRRGIKKACMIDGRIPHSILIEILSDEGIGTMFTGDKK